MGSFILIFLSPVIDIRVGFIGPSGLHPRHQPEFLYEEVDPDEGEENGQNNETDCHDENLPSHLDWGFFFLLKLLISALCRRRFGCWNVEVVIPLEGFASRGIRLTLKTLGIILFQTMINFKFCVLLGISVPAQLWPVWDSLWGKRHGRPNRDPCSKSPYLVQCNHSWNK